MPNNGIHYGIFTCIRLSLYLVLISSPSLPLSPAYFDGHIPALKTVPFWFLSYPCIFKYMLAFDFACKRQYIILFFSRFINYPLPSLVAFPIHLYLSFPFTAFATSISRLYSHTQAHVHHTYTFFHTRVCTHAYTRTHRNTHILLYL